MKNLFVVILIVFLISCEKSRYGKPYKKLVGKKYEISSINLSKRLIFENDSSIVIKTASIYFGDSKDEKVQKSGIISVNNVEYPFWHSSNDAEFNMIQKELTPNNKVEYYLLGPYKYNLKQKKITGLFGVIQKTGKYQFYNSEIILK
jgi:hypothetical protein